MLFIPVLLIATEFVRAQPDPFSFCYGNVAYCATNEVILQCIPNTNGSNFLQPGTCYDILNNPLAGALCAQSGPHSGDAVCFVNGQPPTFPTVSGGTSYQPPTTTIQTTISPPIQTPTDIPGPGDPCFGEVSFCLPPGEFNGTLSEILSCNGTNLIPHDCNDYLNYPPNGALCVYDSFIDGKAVCHAVGEPTPALISRPGGTKIIPTDGGTLVTASPESTNSPSSTLFTSTSTLGGSSSTGGAASASATHTSKATKACTHQIWTIIAVAVILMHLL
jgi:hypothetical protein